jgi:hypothetical protein
LKCGGGEVHQVDEVDLHGMRRRERHRAKTPEGTNQLAAGALEMPSPARIIGSFRSKPAVCVRI